MYTKVRVCVCAHGGGEEVHVNVKAHWRCGCRQVLWHSIHHSKTIEVPAGELQMLNTKRAVFEYERQANVRFAGE